MLVSKKDDDNENKRKRTNYMNCSGFDNDDSRGAPFIGPKVLIYVDCPKCVGD